MEQNKGLEKKFLLVAVFVLVAVALAVVVRLAKNAAPPPPAVSRPSPQPKVQAPPAGGLGGEIYEGVQNPVKGKLPETNPYAKSTNPVSASYKNPFE